MLWFLLAAAILAYAVADFWVRYRHHRETRVLLIVEGDAEGVLEGVIRAVASMVAGVSGGRLIAVVESPARTSWEWGAMMRALARELPGVRLVAAPHGVDLLTHGLSAAGGRVDVVARFDGHVPFAPWLRDVRRLIQTAAKTKKEGKGKRSSGAN
ncbi:MAG: hypothetical protein IRZ18_07190 [Clostridia bacterium]|nr:hypothetical protein [Clostridia bacterium]